MSFFKTFFGKKESEEAILDFSVREQEGQQIIATTCSKNTEKLKDFIRNNTNIDLSLSDEELVYTFIFEHALSWLSEHGKKSMLIEHHTFEAGLDIKYVRNWNDAFLAKIKQLGFDKLPDSEEEIIEGYMNYIYGTRLLEEQEAAQEAEPVSDAHPELSNPSNKLKQ